MGRTNGLKEGRIYKNYHNTNGNRIQNQRKLEIEIFSTDTYFPNLQFHLTPLILYRNPIDSCLAEILN